MAANPLDARIHHPIAYPLVRCPACGSPELDSVVEDLEPAMHFLCRDCDGCWNVDLGYVRRVAPATCLGCRERSRCEPAYDYVHEHGQ